jgi:hypothetical protein
MTIPYTYLLYCVPTNQYYYGVRWAKNCSPSDFWCTYFTSSRYVRKLVSTHGKDAFTFEIRKTFTTPSSAKKWERKVLHRLGVALRNDFLNKHDGSVVDFKDRTWINKDGESKFVDIILLEEYLSCGWYRGRVFSKEHRNKNSLGVKAHYAKNGDSKKGKPLSKEHLEKLSKIRKGHFWGKRFTGNPIVIDGVMYKSVSEASRQLNLAWDVCKKKGIPLTVENGTTP